MREWAGPETWTPETLWRRWWPAAATTIGIGILLAALYGAIVADLSNPSRSPFGTPGSRRSAPPPAGAPRPAALAAPASLAAPAAPAAPAALVANAPRAGAIYSCEAPFPGVPATPAGPWLQPDGTVDLTRKPVVDGAIAWPGRFGVALLGDVRTFTGNALPAHPTGMYPIAPDDDAYTFDRNRNTIREAPLAVSLPATPHPAERPACLPLGPIGVLRTGAVLFNALDAAGRDAVAYEAQDSCLGHPGPIGLYHYHSLTPCLAGASADLPATGAHSGLVGYAFDGFGLYGPRGEDGMELTNADLDACHGHTHAVEWDGAVIELYHYHATHAYPYTIGCFRGAPGVPAGSVAPR